MYPICLLGVVFRRIQPDRKSLSFCSRNFTFKSCISCKNVSRFSPTARFICREKHRQTRLWVPTFKMALLLTYFEICHICFTSLFINCMITERHNEIHHNSHIICVIENVYLKGTIIAHSPYASCNRNGKSQKQWWKNNQPHVLTFSLNVIT